MNFVLPDTGHMNYIQEEDVMNRRRNGWIIYTQCYAPRVEEDKVTFTCSYFDPEDIASSWNSSFAPRAR